MGGKQSQGRFAQPAGGPGNPRCQSNPATGRAGIIAKLATAMAKTNINIVAVNRKIMEDYFVMTPACGYCQCHH